MLCLSEVYLCFAGILLRFAGKRFAFAGIQIFPQIPSIHNDKEKSDSG